MLSSTHQKTLHGGTVRYKGSKGWGGGSERTGGHSDALKAAPKPPRDKEASEENNTSRAVLPLLNTGDTMVAPGTRWETQGSGETPTLLHVANTTATARFARAAPYLCPPPATHPCHRSRCTPARSRTRSDCGQQCREPDPAHKTKQKTHATFGSARTQAPQREARRPARANAHVKTGQEVHSDHSTGGRVHQPPRFHGVDVGQGPALAHPKRAVAAADVVALLRANQAHSAGRAGRAVHKQARPGARRGCLGAHG